MSKGLSNISLSAYSSSDRETRVIRLLSYINRVEPTKFNILTALQKSQITSWTSLKSYFKQIESNYYNDLTENGKENLIIGLRESDYIEKNRNK